MIGWLRQQRRALAAALRRIGTLNILVIGVALSLPAGGYAVLENLRSIAGRFALDPQLSVFMSAHSKRADAQALGKTMRADPRIAAVRFIPREEALRQLSAVQGMPEVIGALGYNPLPDAFVVTSRGASLEALAADLGKLPGVEHVQADAVWARRLAALAEFGRLALLLLTGLLGIGLVAVTFNTIRLQVLTQRDEIEVSRLIGATDAFIRRPFYYLGLLQGAAGAMLAIAIVAGGLSLLNLPFGTLARTYGSSISLTLPSWADCAAIVVFAAFLGAFGSHLSVSRHLRQIEPH